MLRLFQGSGNVLQSVTLANAGGNVEIVNGNATNNNALTVSTAEGTTVGGTINVTNNGEGITVAGINAANELETPDGTVSGILIVQCFLIIHEYDHPTNRPMIIAAIIP